MGRARDRMRVAVTEEILTAAEQVWIERGFTASSMASVAEKAGIAVGTLYNYFTDKQELFAAVVNQKRETIHGKLEDAMTQQDAQPFREHLTYYLQVFEAAIAHGRSFFPVLLQAETWPSLPKGAPTTRQTLQTHLAIIIEKGITEGVLIPEPRLSLILAGMLHSMIQNSIHGGDLSAMPASLVMKVFLEGASKR